MFVAECLGQCTRIDDTGAVDAQEHGRVQRGLQLAHRNAVQQPPVLQVEIDIAARCLDPDDFGLRHTNDFVALLDPEILERSAAASRSTGLTKGLDGFGHDLDA